MRIEFTAVARQELFNELFRDLDGVSTLPPNFLQTQFDVGKPYYDRLMAAFETGKTEAEQKAQFLREINKMTEAHILRYETIDLIYWFEFQNKCTDYLQENHNYLRKEFPKSADIVGREGEFGQRISEFNSILTILFDIVNCENLGNAHYFSMAQELYDMFNYLFNLKLIGCEKVITTIIDLFDSFLQQLKAQNNKPRYASPNDFKLPQTFINLILKDFVDSTRLIQSASSPAALQALQQQKLDFMEKNGFVQVDIPLLKFEVQQQLMFKLVLIQYLLNPSTEDNHNCASLLEEQLPPQVTIELLVNILRNERLQRNVKIATVTTLAKLASLDGLPRFNYTSAKYNPYFSELVKHSQVFIDLFHKVADYHLVTKVENYDSSMDPETLDKQEREGNDIMRSQSFLTDFIQLLEVVARTRIRTVNNTLFSQIQAPLVKLLGQLFHRPSNRYPLNLSIQLVASKLMKSIIRTQTSFDDTEQLSMLVSKLKEEISFLHAQSQQPPSVEITVPHQLFNQSWFGDDDFQGKFQTITARQQLVGSLFQLIEFCILRNDQTVMNQNQNSIAHSRKILEMSLIQDDMLTKVFKVYETFKEDSSKTKLMKQTIVPLVLPSLKFVSTVFNDQPSKVHTFVSNGLFRSILDSLTVGGLPNEPKLIEGIASFMHTMLLTEETRAMLKESKLLEQFFRLGLDPVTYGRTLGANRRMDPRTDSQLMGVVNHDDEFCRQYFDTILFVLNQVVERSHLLSKEYVSMKDKMKTQEERSKLPTLTCKERSALELEMYQMKESYDRNQKLLEITFDVFLGLNQFLADRDTDDSQASRLFKFFRENKKQLLECIYESLENPVLASTLFEQNEIFVGQIFQILNAMDSRGPLYIQQNGFGEDVAILVKRIIDNLALQLDNLQELLGVGSSLMEDTQKWRFSMYPDIVLTDSSKGLALFECSLSTRDKALEFKQYINSSDRLNQEDSCCIVIRKMQFYTEILTLFMRLKGFSNSDLLLRHPKFHDVALGIQELQELINRNRAMSFSNQLKDEKIQLQTYLKEFGAEVTEHDFSDAKYFESPTVKAYATDLMKARHLYYKFKVANVKKSLHTKYSELSEKVNALNFDTSDNICLSAQSFNASYRRFMKHLLANLAAKKTAHMITPDFAKPYLLSSALGERQILEMDTLLNRALALVNEGLDLTREDAQQTVSTIAFELITCLHYAKKILQQNAVPGGFIKAILDQILDKKYFSKLFEVATKLTVQFEGVLKLGGEINLFQAQSVKILWKEIQTVVEYVVSASFIPQEKELQKFLFDFSNGEILEADRIYDLSDKFHWGQNYDIQVQIITEAKKTLTKQLKQVLLDLGLAFLTDYAYTPMLGVLSQFSQSCLSQVTILQEKIKNDFSNHAVIKRIGAEHEIKRITQLDRDDIQIMSQSREGDRNRLAIVVRQPNIQNQSPEELAQIASEAARIIGIRDPNIEQVDHSERREGWHLSDVAPWEVEREPRRAENGSQDEIVESENEESRPSKDSKNSKDPNDGSDEERKKKSEADENKKREDQRKKLEPILMEFFKSLPMDVEAFEKKIHEVVIKYHAQITSPEVFLYKNYAFNEESGKVLGIELQTDKVYQMIHFFVSKITGFKTSHLHNAQDIMDLLLRHIRYLFDHPLESAEDLKKPEVMTQTLWGVYVLKCLFESHLLFGELANRMKIDEFSLLSCFTNIITLANKRLATVFAKITSFRQAEVSSEKKETAAMKEVKGTQLGLANVLLQFSQEFVQRILFFQQLKYRAEGVSLLAKETKNMDLTLKGMLSKEQADAADELAEEGDVVGQIEGQFRNSFFDRFFSKKDQSSEERNSEYLKLLERLLVSQIEVLATFSETPFQVVAISQSYLMSTVLSVELLKYTMKLGDFLEPSDSDGLTLRKLFKSSNGLKHLFGIRIIDPFCSDPSQFNDVADRMGDSLNADVKLQNLICELVSILVNNPRAMIQRQENQLKAIIFVQYAQNLKKETGKEIHELYKLIFENMAQRQSESPRAGKKSAGKIPPKKAKDTKDAKESKVDLTKGSLGKLQQKQLKAQLKKYEGCNEFSLEVFIEFFNTSTVLHPIADMDHFLTACKNCCLLDCHEGEAGAKTVTLRMKNSVLKEMILTDVRYRSTANRNWLQELKKGLHNDAKSNDLWANEIVSDLLEILVNQSKGLKMSLLKQIHNQTLDEPQKLLIKPNKDNIKKLSIQPKELQAGEKTIKYLEMSQFLLRQNVVLQALGQEIRHKPLMVGSVLRHQQGNTFKYIVRNILSLLDLKIKTTDFFVEFEEQEDMDGGVVSFFGSMLMFNHTMNKQFLIFKQEARRIFVKELAKNLVDHENYEWAEQSHTFNIRLLFNYHAILILSKFVLIPEARTPSYEKMQDRQKALHQAIRRFNQAQKNTILNQLLFEVQCSKVVADESASSFKLSLFSVLLRIVKELKSAVHNPGFIVKQPRAVMQTTDVVHQVLSVFAKNEDFLKKISSEEGNDQHRYNLRERSESMVLNDKSSEHSAAIDDIAMFEPEDDDDKEDDEEADYGSEQPLSIIDDEDYESEQDMSSYDDMEDYEEMEMEQDELLDVGHVDDESFEQEEDGEDESDNDHSMSSFSSQSSILSSSEGETVFEHGRSQNELASESDDYYSEYPQPFGADDIHQREDSMDYYAESDQSSQQQFSDFNHQSEGDDLQDKFNDLLKKIEQARKCIEFKGLQSDEKGAMSREVKDIIKNFETIALKASPSYKPILKSQFSNAIPSVTQLLKLCTWVEKEKEGELVGHLSLSENFMTRLGVLIYLLQTHYFSQISCHALFLARIPFFKTFKVKEEPEAKKEDEMKEEEALEEHEHLAKRADPKANLDDQNILVTLQSSQGYQDFLKAVNIIQGKEQVEAEESDQIDTTQPNRKSTLNELNPLFQSALTNESIEAIKKQDDIRRRMQQSAAFKPQVQTINEFIERLSPSVRQHVLKGLDNDILSKLSSKYFAEAQTLRGHKRENATSRQGGASELPVGANMARHRQQRQQQQQTQQTEKMREGLADTTNEPTDPMRDRFLSMDSLTINIKKDPRDSESEDINMPQHRGNFDANGFFLGIHQFMRENQERLSNLEIRDWLLATSQMKSKKKEANKHHIFTTLDLHQYCEKLLLAQIAFDDDHSAKNMAMLQGLLDMQKELVTTMGTIYGPRIHSNIQTKQKVLWQIPYFRFSLQAKLVSLMNSEVKNIIESIRKQQQVNSTRAFSKFQVVTTEFLHWTSLDQTQAAPYSPLEAITRLLEVVRLFQQSIYEQKKESVLDILKSPKHNPLIKQIIMHSGLSENLAGYSFDEAGHIQVTAVPQNETYSVFDMILHVFNVLTELMMSFSEAFPHKQTQQSQFRYWKGAVLHKLSVFFSQFVLEKEAPLQKEDLAHFSKGLNFNQDSLNLTLQLLCFFRSQTPTLSKHQPHLDRIQVKENIMISTSKNDINHICQIINSISRLPLTIEKDEELKCQIDVKNWKGKSIAAEILAELIGKEVTDFSSSFSGEQSLFTGVPEAQRKQISRSLDRILYVYLIQSNMKKLPDSDKQQKHLRKILNLAQGLIDKEEAITSDETQSYLYREEFRKLMQLIFTLAQTDLEKISRKQKQKNSKSMQKLNQLRTEEENKDGQDGKDNKDGKGAKDAKKSFVVVQSEDELKAMYSDPNGRTTQTTVETEEQVIAQLTADFSEVEASSIKNVLEFFFRNQTMINKFIHVNQSVVNDQLLSLVSLVPQLFNFSSKRLLWRIVVKNLVKKKQRQSDDYDIEIGVRRSAVFGDSFEQLKDLAPVSWYQKFIVDFHEEEGIDEGGLTKEWFQLISQGIFDPNYALFLQSSKGSTYFPNPHATIHDQGEVVSLFRFVGRIIAKAMIEGQLLDCYFVRAIYKMLLKQQLELSDLEDFDEQVYKSLVYVLQNDPSMLCQTFELSSNYFDENKSVSLKPGGADIDVTNENKFEYCQLVLHYKLYECIKVQLDSFLQGFQDIVPSSLVKIFNAKELELMISGLPTIDIQDLKKYTIYTNYSANDAIIRWLWEILEEFTQVDRAEFIQFVTGTSKVPVEGFKGLRGGANGQIQKVEVTKFVCPSPDEKLPCSHTCFFQLDLPQYSSKEVLKQKLLLAIRECKTFNIA